jgi:hypothetical protein
MADSKLDLGNIERFNGENFHLWKFQMRAVFLGKDLMGVVDGSEVKPEAAGPEQLAWTKRDNQGISLLCQALDKKYLQHVISCNTSNAIWAKLKLIHEQDASESIHALQQKFYRCTLGESESLASFMSNIEVIVNQLASRVDTMFTDKAIIAKVMSSLPAGYDSLLSAWDSTPDASKTLETLTLRLYQQETRIKNRAEAQSQSNKNSAYVSVSSKAASGKDSKEGTKGRSADSRPNQTYEQRQARRKEIDDKKKETECWKCGSIGH